jgi:2-keto-3-deoxy-6-phosphogluconate aldolase
MIEYCYTENEDVCSWSLAQGSGCVFTISPNLHPQLKYFAVKQGCFQCLGAHTNSQLTFSGDWGGGGEEVV